MEIYEITGFRTAVDRSGVNFLEPADTFQEITNGFIYRQVLQSRQGIGFFTSRLSGNVRVMGFYELTPPDYPSNAKQLLAFDKNNMYRYNSATGSFDLIPFAGSIAAYGGFNLSNDQYISCCAYPTATNSLRLIICGLGINPAATGSSIFFYDGTDIRDFTNVIDNPNYANPSGGTLTKAKYCAYFGERLLFFSPVIGATQQQQFILYSGIRDSSGKGDKFNVAGAGSIAADTSDYISGIQRLGQVMVVLYSDSNYTLEITTDAFNPFFIRKTPGLIGTNADFSAVSWYNECKSIGKRGCISSDGRQSARFDDKIPYFTRDDIGQTNFNLIYGGFDRFNNQFLWTYPTDNELTTQDKVLVYNYEENSWSTFEIPLTTIISTEVGNNLVWDDIDASATNPSWGRWDKTEEIWDQIGLGDADYKTLAGDDLGFVYELNKDLDDYFSTISNITPGDTTTLTVSASNWQVNDLVVIENVEGMVEINNYDPDTDIYDGSPYTILSVTSPTQIEIDCDSSDFSAYTPNTGTVTKIITFSAKTIPFNPWRSAGRRVFVSHIEFLLDNNGCQLLVDVIENEDSDPFKQNILCEPNINSTNQKQWVTMIVNDEAEFMTFVLKQISPAVQLKLYSMRIHCAPGGYTSG